MLECVHRLQLSIQHNNPTTVINKLSLLGLNNSLQLDPGLFNRKPQSVRVGHNTSSTTTLSTGAPQGCVLSPLLFTLLTHDCTAKFSSNHIIKFARWHISGRSHQQQRCETHYREEVAQLAEWCGANNLSLNVEKTKEVVMDFQEKLCWPPPTDIDTSTVERVSSTKFLGVQSQRTSPGLPTPSLSPRRHNSAYTFSPAERASLPPPILTTFYRGTMRACWPAASLSGTETAVQQTARPSSGQWTPLQKSLVPLSPPSWTFPYTMLQQSKKYRGGHHPPLPQSLPAPTLR